MEKDKKGINHTSTDEHKKLCDIMSEFMDNGKPKVAYFGITSRWAHYLAWRRRMQKMCRL